MKPLSLTILTVLLLFAFGCKNSADSNTIEKVEQVSITSSEIFEYPTGIWGDEELAAITEQASHHEISEIVRDSTTNWEAVYRYKAENEFQGTDRVELNLGTGSDGASSNTHFELITIEFTVD